MIKFGLRTMPQTSLALPSIGLTQIATTLREQYGDKAQVDIFYPCLDFADFIGLSNYLELQATGLVPWSFRKEAFPLAEDNTDIFKKFFIRKAVIQE